jgi:hypothetical protein
VRSEGSRVQVLDGLRLARARRPLRQPAAVEVERGGERRVAAVGERRDDEAARVAQVLVSIERLRIGLLDDAALRTALLPIEAQLEEPLKVVDRRAAGRDHPRDRVAAVHLDGDDGDDLLAVEIAERAAHHVAQLVEQRDLLLLGLAHRALGALAERDKRLCALVGPRNLAAAERELARPEGDPLLALGPAVRSEATPSKRATVKSARQRRRRRHCAGLGVRIPQLTSSCPGSIGTCPWRACRTCPSPPRPATSPRRRRTSPCKSPPS